MADANEGAEWLLSRLVTLVPPPDRPLETPDVSVWNELEAELGTALPSDVKLLLRRYGTGRFGRLIWVLNPAASSRYLRVDLLMNEIREDERIMALQSGYRPPPYRLWPASPGLIPAAGTDNGDEFFWLAERGVDPDDWRVAIRGSRDIAPELMDGPLIAILLGVLDTSVRLDALPSDVPPEFESRT